MTLDAIPQLAARRVCATIHGCARSRLSPTVFPTFLQADSHPASDAVVTIWQVRLRWKRRYLAAHRCCEARPVAGARLGDPHGSMQPAGGDGQHGVARGRVARHEIATHGPMQQHCRCRLREQGQHIGRRYKDIPTTNQSSQRQQRSHERNDLALHCTRRLEMGLWKSDSVSSGLKQPKRPTTPIVTTATVNQ